MTERNVRRAGGQAGGRVEDQTVETHSARSALERTLPRDFYFALLGPRL